VKDKFYFKKRVDVVKIVVALEVSMSMMECGAFGNVVSSLVSVLEST